MPTDKKSLEKQLILLISKKETYFGRLQTLYDYGQNLDNAASLQHFVAKLELLEKTKVEFMRIIDRINEIQLDLDEEFKPNFQSLDAFDDLYCSILLSAKDPRVVTIRSSKIENNQRVKLPKLILPTFSGDIKEWEVFYECFKSLIHDNADLSDVDKINYLIGQLSGKALNVCSGLPPTGSNYHIIWNTLVERYRNTRFLATTYLEQVLTLKPAQKASANSLNNILEKGDAAVRALKILKIDDLTDFIFAYLLWSKLDPETRNLFENARRKFDIFTYKEVLDFIKEQAQICAISSISNKPNTSSNSVKSIPHAFFVGNKKDANECIACKEKQHYLGACDTFLAKSPADRYQFVKDQNLCINCFGKHKVFFCKGSVLCKVCKHKHHTLLHFVKPRTEKVDEADTSKIATFDERPNNSAASSVVPPMQQNTSTFCSTLCSSQFGSTVLLSTAIVNVLTKNGTSYQGRFLLDSGSQAHFLTLTFAKKLGLYISGCDSSVKGIGMNENLVQGQASTVISSRFDANISFLIDVLVIEKITERLPNYRVHTESLKYLFELPLADETFDRPGPIDGIIGAELFPTLLGSERVTGSIHSPIAVQTKLGYVVMGSAPTIHGHSKDVRSFCATVEPALENLISKFWDVEDITPKQLVSPEDMECEKIYTSTVRREASGRYVVSLPFKASVSILGDSHSIALKRFQALERKFDKSFEYREQYHSVIKEYLQQGYMSLSEEISFPNYFIPHHGVFKHESSSTPLRCVFDASCKSTSQISLNDLLFTGPKLQTDVVGLFLNFRLFPIAFTADIKQMYLRVGIENDHRRFQQILWRFSKDDPVSAYCLNTVAFGVKSSPFLALRTLLQLADDESENYPLASKIVPRDFYMDDLVSSVASLEEAKILCQELLALFAAGQFQLTKWAANSEELLRIIPETDHSPKVVKLNSDEVLKVLGLQWYPGPDIFGFTVCAEFRDCTKRNVLSTVARLFDPLGFLAPVTLLLKLLIKKLWSLKLDWDEVPVGELPNQWRKIQNELALLAGFKITRHLGVFQNSKVTLVGFCDACKESYGAVVYIRTMSPDGNVVVILAGAKTKVAPMKVQSIPRLELCAAVLLSRLMNLVNTTLESRVVIEELFALSDSTVVLSWIASSPHRWQTFVGNRVARIHELVPSGKWYHVSGRDNMSDGLSRGMKPSHFLKCEDWKYGPPWLKLDPSQWPIRSILDSDEQLPEQRIISLVITQLDAHPLYSLILRCSSWSKLLCSTVFVLRFVRILKTSGLIGAADLERAELLLINVVQRQHFHAEISLIEKNRPCSPQFRSLTPFLLDGLLRVGGRLDNSNLEFDRQHPFLLPNDDNFTHLLIDECHRKNLHTGPHLTLSILRQKYWIIGGRNAVRYRLQKCNHCFRINPKPTFPKMADLPAIRVTEAKPFLHCGVDYAGPLFITMTKARGVKSQKAYLCLFICLVTKALHLELVSSLSTDMFLAAFKRFLARRGACSIIYSDCGTTFIGAKNCLDDLYRLINSESYQSVLQREFLTQKIVWKFQPPLSPHFSGVWESQIKAVKTHLHKVIGLQILSYEEMITVLGQIEALLNSRPLSWLSTDPSDPLPLTPGHFLTLTPLTSLPASNELDTPSKLLDRKKLLDHMVQTFWQRWRVEYLSNLQQRQKWNLPSSPIKENTLVIIKEDHVPPLQWPTGIIEKVIPGLDGIVRVAIVRTKSGTYKRPIVRLCPLPSQ